MRSKFFAPASITCFFAPVLREDPLKSGSLGVSIALCKGVRVSVEPSNDLTILVNGERWEFPTIQTIIDILNFKGKIWIEMDFPAGCGFGMSGASALASALAINQALNLNKSFFELADLAHKAEVINRTGLGDVVTQSFGGVVVRKSASCPSKCSIDRFLWNLNLDLLIMGDLPTEQILSDLSLDEIVRVGKACLKEFLRNPTIENLFRQSKAFAVETDLINIDSTIADAIEAVESSDGLASMVMLGRAVFAIHGDVLKDFSGIYLKAKVDHCGVRMLD